MTIETNTVLGTYVGNGATDTYSIPFKFFDNTTVIVKIDGQLQVEGVGYLITGDGGEGTASLELAVFLPNGATLTVERVVPYKQEVDITSQGAFLPETFEDGLDILAMQIQQLAAAQASVLAMVQGWEIYVMSTTPTTMTQTEVILDSATVTQLPNTAGRVAVEIQNNGPNPIWIGPATNVKYRVLQPKESWTVDFQGALYGLASVADQVTGAATVVTELS